MNTVILLVKTFIKLIILNYKNIKNIKMGNIMRSSYTILKYCE